MKVTVHKDGLEKEIFVTTDHRWIVSTTKFSQANNRIMACIKTTNELEPGHILWHSGGRLGHLPTLSPDGIRAGFVHGDGSIEKNDRFGSARVSFFGEKDSALAKYFNEYYMSEPKVRTNSKSEFMSDNGVPFTRAGGLPRKYKSLPDLEESSSFLYGWLAGYFAADGNIHPGGTSMITSHKRESLEAVRNICEILRISHGVILESDVEKLGKIYREYTISINYRELPNDFFLIEQHRKYHEEMIKRSTQVAKRWTVKSIERTDSIEEVFCVVQPETERFALPDGILTMNCPRRWVMAFQGAEFDEEQDAVAVDRMETGTDAHERIQKNLHQSNITLDVEWEFWNIDPPMHGFIDIILRDFHGFDIVVEIKTTRTEAFQARRAHQKGPDYQVLQLLLYMHFLGIKHGLLLYEDKNDHSKLLIPVEMDDVNKEKIEAVVQWMQTVYKTYENGDLPKRPFRKNSKICQSCPLLKWCGEQPEGTVDLPALGFTQDVTDG
jgi:CRISPR/Cas system-associated exonuclease Cas4 (RecB family)